MYLSVFELWQYTVYLHVRLNTSFKLIIQVNQSAGSLLRRKIEMNISWC